MTDLTVLVLAILATYRLAELVSVDSISEPVRLAAGKRAGDSRSWKFLADLINCPFCTGVWIALAWAGVLAYIGAVTGVVSFIIYWMAIAGGQAFLESITPER